MVREYSLSELVGLLNQVTGLDDEQLASRLDISRQTISNWRNNRVDKIKPATIFKLAGALKKNNWGIRIGDIRGSKIEIVQNGNDSKSNDKDEMIYKLLKENFKLKEELEKYKSKKK